jgi:hypothetical protein
MPNIVTKVKERVASSKMLPYVTLAMTGLIGTASAAVNFTDAAATIDAVSTDLIGPIANLVIKLIVLFVALFVIRMMRSIFGGVGDAVGRQL